MSDVNDASYYAIPDRKSLVGRPELVRRCTPLNGKPVLLSAPAQFGKSSLAMLCAREFKQGVWVDAHAKTDERLASEIERAIVELDDFPHAIAVIDDWQPGSAPSDSFKNLTETLAPYVKTGLTCIVTATDVEPSVLVGEEVGGWSLFGASDLLFSFDEVKLLMGRADFASLGLSPEGLMQKTGGMPSLVTGLLDPRASRTTLERDREKALLEMLMVRRCPDPELLLALLGYGSGSVEELELMGITPSYQELLALQETIPMLGVASDSLHFEAPLLASENLERIAQAQEADPSVFIRLGYALAQRGDLARAASFMLVGDSMKPAAGELADWICLWGRALLDEGEFALSESLDRRLSPSVAMESPECILIATERQVILRGCSSRVLDLASSALPLVTGYANKTRCAELRARSALSQGNMVLAKETLLSLAKMEMRAGQDAFGSRASGKQRSGRSKSAATPVIRALDLATLAYGYLLFGDTKKAAQNAQRALRECASNKTFSYERAQAMELLTKLDILFETTKFRESSYVKGIVAQEPQDFGDALIQLEAARIYVSLGLVERARGYLDFAKMRFALTRTYPASFAYIEGLVLHAEKRYEEAGSCFRAALKKENEDTCALEAGQVRLAWAVMLREEGELDVALSQAYAANQVFVTHDLDLFSVLSQCEIGRVYMAQHEHRKAIAIEQAGLLAPMVKIPLVTNSYAELSKEIAQVRSRGDGPSFHVPPPLVEIPSNALCIKLFGTVELSCGDKAECAKDWRKRKALTLLCWLALAPGRDISRETVLTRLWGDMTHDQARNNFYVTHASLVRLLKQLGVNEECLSSKGGVCRLDSSMVYTDLMEFDLINERLVTLDDRENPREIMELYRRMRHLYRGPLAPGTTDDKLFIRAREMYHDKFVQGMIHASQVALSVDDPKLAVWFAQQALEHEGGREEVYRALMRAQSAANQQGGALETYHRCRKHLSEELGITPSFETVEVYKQLLSC